MDWKSYLFPRRCLGCNQVGNYFCPDCRQNLKPIIRSVCPFCDQASIWGVTHAACQRQFGLNGLVSLFAYQDLMVKAIKKLKYRLVTDLVEELVEILVARLKISQGQIWPRWGKEWLLVPVPLFPLRERKRGFNQTVVLGKPVAKIMDWQFAQILKRQKPTLPQAEIEDKRQRWLNIRGAFALNKKANFKLKGKKIIVFDDVWTTGNTLKESAQVLKRAGVNQVWGLVLSR